MKKLINIALAIILIAAFASCESEEPVVDLKLNNTAPIELQRNGTASIAIESGNGGYTVKSSNEKVATATLSGQSIAIKAVSEGTADITVTDAKGKSATIKVTVSYKMPTESKLLWNGESVEFDKAGAAGIALLSNGVAVTDLATAKKQYCLTWAEGLSEGDKPEGKMILAEAGKQPETTSLTTVKVLQTGDKGNFIMFEGDGKSGWILFHNK